MNYCGKSPKLVVCIIAVLVVVAALTGGCIFKKPTSETGVVSDVTMSLGIDANNRPVNPTNVFPVDSDGFFCSFKLSGFPVGAKLEVQWIYVGGDPDTEFVVGTNYVAETQTAEITKSSSGYTSTLYSRPALPDYLFPKGDYKVVISVDGIEKASTPFKVQ